VTGDPFSSVGTPAGRRSSRRWAVTPNAGPQNGIRHRHRRVAAEYHTPFFKAGFRIGPMNEVFPSSPRALHIIYYLLRRVSGSPGGLHGKIISPAGVGKSIITAGDQKKTIRGGKQKTMNMKSHIRSTFYSVSRDEKRDSGFSFRFFLPVCSWRINPPQWRPAGSGPQAGIVYPARSGFKHISAQRSPITARQSADRG
jgi:hypothetical protein